MIPIRIIDNIYVIKTNKGSDQKYINNRYIYDKLTDLREKKMSVCLEL